MQHFGLPTRLLDWTASPLTALYFAVAYEQRPGAAAVWTLHPPYLNLASSGRNAIMITLTNVSSAGPLLQSAFTGGPVMDDVQAVVGQEIDLRLAVQQAAFTIHGTATPLEQRPGAEQYLFKFVIPEKAREPMRKELRSLGIRRSMLFPDLANLAADLADDVPRVRAEDPPRTPAETQVKRARARWAMRGGRRRTSERKPDEGFSR